MQNTEISADPSGQDTPLTLIEPEKVAIDGKTYDCTNYTSTDDDGTSYYWLASRVPVLVKYEIHSGDSITTAELVSWS